MKLFSYDNPIITFFRQAVDYMLLGLLWLVASLPIFTHGAATSAALITAGKAIRQEEGHMLSTFFRHFRQEFRQATQLWLIQLPIMLLVGGNIWLLVAAKLPDWIEIIMSAVCLIIYSVAKLLLAYQSTFNDTLKTILRNCLIIGVGRFLPVLGMGLADLLAFGIAFFLLFTTPPLMAIVPGIALFFYSALSRKVFKPYMPTTSSNAEA